MNKAQVESRLLRWAKWKLGCGNRLGYPTEVSFMKMSGSTNPSVHDPLLDMEAAQTNDAVEMLPLLHQAVIRVEYFHSGNESHKAHRFGMQPRYYRRYRDEAYRLLANMIDTLLTGCPETGTNSAKSQYVRPTEPATAR